MKYKGFFISPVYYVGSDYRIDSRDVIHSRRCTTKDVEYYEVLDPMDNMQRYCAEFTVAACKESIDSLLARLGMESNHQTEWRKLDA